LGRRAFSTVWLVSPEKLIRSSHKKLSDISLDKEVLVKFCKDSGVQIAFTSVEDCFVV